MLYQILLIISFAAGGGDEQAGDTTAAASAATAQAPAASPSFTVEDQTPSGRFLTAGEVRPILDATRNNWISVREFNGQDLVYVTHLLAWRCGLHQIEWQINEGPWQVWPMAQCYIDEPAPAAIKPEDPEPYVGYALGSVQSVGIRLLYDDMGEDQALFGRNGMEIK